MQSEKVVGAEDINVQEILEELPSETIYEVTTCFQRRFRGVCEAPISWEIVRLVFWWNPHPSAVNCVRCFRAV